jgi:hypothetical protein
MKLEALSGMQNLPTWLRLAINHYGYITLVALPAVIVALLLALVATVPSICDCSSAHDCGCSDVVANPCSSIAEHPEQH